VYVPAQTMIVSPDTAAVTAARQSNSRDHCNSSPGEHNHPVGIVVIHPMGHCRRCSAAQQRKPNTSTERDDLP